MKHKYLFLLLTLLLTSCKAPAGTTKDISETFNGVTYISFDNSSEDKDKYYFRNGYSNGGMFKSIWKRDNVQLNGGVAEFSLYDDNDKNYGVELTTKQGFLYGYFGARVKTFKKAGTVQSIFTYNGGRYDWDEIDIEFLGKDTTKVQFNYYDNGVGGHEYLYDLGFDSSLEFHDYGFKWDKDKITWFVDFKPVYQLEATLTQWGFLFANVWAGNNDYTTDWLGQYEKDDSKHVAYYDSFYYAPLEEAEEE